MGGGGEHALPRLIIICMCAFYLPKKGELVQFPQFSTQRFHQAIRCCWTVTSDSRCIGRLRGAMDSAPFWGTDQDRRRHCRSSLFENRRSRQRRNGRTPRVSFGSAYSPSVRVPNDDVGRRPSVCGSSRTQMSVSRTSVPAYSCRCHRVPTNITFLAPQRRPKLRRVARFDGFVACVCLCNEGTRARLRRGSCRRPLHVRVLSTLMSLGGHFHWFVGGQQQGWDWADPSSAPSGCRTSCGRAAPVNHHGRRSGRRPVNFLLQTMDTLVFFKTWNGIGKRVGIGLKSIHLDETCIPPNQGKISEKTQASSLLN